jgi:probable F420-dependent oxidoreductase
MTVFGISLLRVAPGLWQDVAQEAEQLGFESVWMSDHLVLPAEIDASHYPDGKLPIRPETPVFDVLVYLAALAARTTTLRLGTFIYQLGLRDPLVAARAVATLDVVSDGRVELGIGAGWMPDEWAAAGIDFASRGRRLDEALAACRTLWTDPVPRHEGEFFRFPRVRFEPKPVQDELPIHVGGESAPALRRAVRVGTGWIGMHHTPASVAPVLSRLAALAEQSDRSAPLCTTAAAAAGADIDVDGWRGTGIDRVLVAPWQRSRDAIAGMQTFADRHLR